MKTLQDPDYDAGHSVPRRTRCGDLGLCQGVACATCHWPALNQRNGGESVNTKAAPIWSGQGYDLLSDLYLAAAIVSAVAVVGIATGYVTQRFF